MVLFDEGKTFEVRSGRVAVAVPAKKARVCVAPEEHRRRE